MCGRFLFIAEGELAEIIQEAQRNLDASHIPYTVQSGEIFPKNLVPILAPKDGRLITTAAFWGFTNHLQRENAQRAMEGKKPLKPKAVFNTRGETSATNGFWRDSLHNRRCLVPTSGFFEWQQLNKTEKQEYFFQLPHTDITMVAGIWHSELDEQTGNQFPHFSMLTTAPNESVRAIHDRMPVVLLPHEYDQWLHGDYLNLINRQGVSLTKQTI